MRRFVAASLAAVAAWGMQGAGGVEGAQMERLPSGLSLVVLENPSNEVAAATALIRGGASADPEGKAGLAALAARLLIKGTSTRSAAEIALSTESIGASLDADAEDDYIEVSVQSIADTFPKALEIFADVLARPTFPQEEFEKEKALLLSELRRRRDDKFSRTYDLFLATLYAGHPYAWPSLGTEKTVAGLTRDDVERFWREHFKTGGMVVGACTPAPAAEVSSAVAAALAALPAGSPAPLPEPAPLRLDGPVECREATQFEQSFIILGFPSPSILETDDYVAMKVASVALGGGMSSRLFQSLRDREGLGYAVGAACPTRRLTGHLMCYIGVKSDQVERAKEIILEEIARLRTEEIPAEELERAKRYAVGTYAMQHERNLKQAWYPAWYEALGVGYKLDAAYPDLVAKVTASDVLRVAEHWLTDYALAVVEPETR